ncbi:MAG: AarF/UbiB family protein [Acidimicrobiales bacterium]
MDGERLLHAGHQRHARAHDRLRIFHGDLHADNVLINPQGDFSLIGFGIAGRIDAEQRAATVMFLFGFGRNDQLLQLRALQAFGAVPPGADLPTLASEIEAQLMAIDPTLLTREGEFTVDRLGQALGSVIRVLARNGFSLPKELVLFFKNLLYLNGFASTLAPGTDLFGHIEPTFLYFVGKYPEELGAIMTDVL